METGRNERNLISEMIGAAVLAGAYRALVKEHPDAERGLLKMATKHSRRVQALAGEFLADAGFELASAIVPHTREG